MYELINFTPTLTRAGAVNMNLDRFLNIQKEAIGKVVDFYRTFVHNGPSNSPFIRILYNNTFDTTVQPMGYYGRYDADELLSVYGFTGDTHGGDIHEGFFYGKAKTVIISDSDSTLAEVIRTNWQDLEPIKVLATPNCSQSLVRPDMREDEDGFAILKVDLPMLGFMYGSWLKTQANLPMEDKERPEDFLVRYVYPNMLYSQFRAALISSLGQEYVLEKDTLPNPTPILVMDKSYECFEETRELFSKLGDEVTFDQFMLNIPDIQHDNLLEGYPVPTITENLYTYWALLLASVPLMDSFINFCFNNPELDTLKPIYLRYKRRIKNQSVLNKIGDDDAKLRIQLMLDKLDTYFI